MKKIVGFSGHRPHYFQENEDGYYWLIETLSDAIEKSIVSGYRIYLVGS